MPDPLTGHQRVLLFGGSFDPPHRAHVELPQQVARAIDADLIAYIPAGRAPHKLDRVQTDPQHRLAMLRLALADQPNTVVLTDELDRAPGQPSYTVDTLAAIRKRIDSATELRLLIGADQVRIFDQWREPERVIALAQPVVMVRPPDTRASLLDSLPTDQRAAWEQRLVYVDAMHISSTQVREQINAGMCTDASADTMIAPEVARYIASNGLYR